MTYVFDFHEFARRFSDSDTVTDVWGDVHTISDVEIILPVSVMKLWDSYKSLSHYLKCCEEFHHGFAVTKTCEKIYQQHMGRRYTKCQKCGNRVAVTNGRTKRCPDCAEEHNKMMARERMKKWKNSQA